MPDYTTASSILNSLIVTGSGHTIHISADAFARSPEARNYLRMLVVIAAPVAAADGVSPPLSPPLDVWGEWERLRAGLEVPIDPVAGAAAAWAVVRLAEPTPERLRDALATGPGYHVVHFIGHGSRDGLLLEDSLGREQFVPTADLMTILAGDGSRPAPELVVFNACETQPVAQAVVAAGAAAAGLATRQPIFDLEAKLLAERFYRRLGGGATVAAALDEFRRTLIERLRSGELPHLGDPAARAANVVLVGDASLRLQAEPPAAARPCFVLDAARHNEPLPLSLVHGFVGRATEQVMLARWLRREGTVVFAISGTGGAGKSALALNTALCHSHRFDALVFASAKGIPDFGPLQVVQALDAALGMALAPDEAGNLPGALTRRLNGNRPVLLLLDNLESVAPMHAAELARALAGVDPRHGSRVIMTLRPDDRDPLTALARGDKLTLRDLDRPSALRLAWEEATGLRLDLTGLAPAQPSTPQAAAEIRWAARRAWLEWLPFAQAAALDELASLAFRHPALIEKAVRAWSQLGWPRMRARLAGLQGKEIAEALDDFIGQMADDLAARAPAGLALLYAALPFVSGAALPYLRFVALAADVADDSPEAIRFEDEALLPAVAAGLLRNDAGRCDLDAPVRAYLEARRPPDPAARRGHELRHAETFLPLVAAYDDLIDNAGMTYSAPLEWANVTAALERLVARAPADDAAARLLVAYSRDWRNVLYNNHDPRRLVWLTAAVAAAERVGEKWEQANVLQAQGDVLAFQDRRDAALGKYEAALGLFRAVGARLGEANVLKAQGDVLAFQDRRDAALGKYEAALGLFRAVGARLGEANVLKAQGDVLAFQDRRDAALGKYEAALGLFRAVGDRLGEANVLKAQGDVLAFQDRRDAALGKYEAALGLFRAVGARLGEANVLKAQGDVLAFQKQNDAALGKYEAALGLFRAVGDRLGEANVLKAQGDVLAFQDRRDAALGKYEAALGLFRAVGDRLGEANVLKAQGDVLAFQKQNDAALGKYEAALGLFRAVGARLGEANVLKAQGDVLAFQDRRDAALGKYEAALGLFRAVGDRLGEANVLKAQGDVLAFQDRRDAALGKYEAALGLFRAVGARLGEANVLQAQGDVLAFQDRRDAALGKYEAALGLFRAVGARLGEANVLKAQGDVLAFQDRRDAALGKYEAALGLFRAVGARLGEANVLKAQGDVLAFQDRRDAALGKYEAALGLFRAVGARLGEANVLKAQGDVLAFQKQNDAALGKYEAALGLFRAVGARLGEANVLKAQGDVLAFQKQNDAALGKYEAALGLFRAVGARLGEANVLKAQGDVLAFQDRRDAALGKYEAALGLFRAVGDRLGEANVLKAQGDVLAFQDRRDAALGKYEAALGLFRAVGARLGEANVLKAQGDVLAFQKQNDAALGKYEAALGLFRAVGDRLGEANVFASQGQLAVVQGDQERADCLLEQAVTIYQAVGSRYSVPAQIGNYGWALLRADELDRARPYLLQAAQLFVEMGLDDYAQRHMQAAGVPTDPAELRAQLEQAASTLREQGDQEQLAQVLAALIELMQQQEDWYGTVSVAEKLISLGATNAQTWAALADARSNLQDETAAAEAYAQAVALAPDQAMLRRNYANSLVALGRLDEAATQLDTAEALDPDSPYLALRRAELAKARGVREEAARWAQEALRRQPQWDEAQRVYDWATGSGA